MARTKFELNTNFGRCEYRLSILFQSPQLKRFLLPSPPHPPKKTHSNRLALTLLHNIINYSPNIYSMHCVYRLTLGMYYTYTILVWFAFVSIDRGKRMSVCERERANTLDVKIFGLQLFQCQQMTIKFIDEATQKMRAEQDVVRITKRNSLHLSPGPTVGALPSNQIEMNRMQNQNANKM